jgi:hypothetical protein
MDGIEHHHVKQNKLDSERYITHAFSHMWNLKQHNNKSRREEEG